MIGTTVSHYRITEKLGGGGMGVVYKAEDTRLRRTVALKFLPPEMTRDADAKERFIREAQAASALDHPSICTIHDIDETDDGRSFICMAYYPGRTLKYRIREGSLTFPESVEFALQIAEGLSKAHSRGIVHRDIKPANILVTEDGRAKIVDFGLAKLAGETRLTKMGTTVGTVAYMSPEQARGDPVDERTDIWSLGAVLYEMVTGHPPFEADYDQAVLYMICHEDPKPMTAHGAGVPPDLDAIVQRSLCKDPDGRYQDVAAFHEDLRLLAGESTGRAVVAGARPARARRFLGSPARVAVAAVVLVAAGWLLLHPSGRSAVSGWLGLARPPVERHVAVLPLASEASEGAGGELADGLVEYLTLRLGQLEHADDAVWVVPAAEIRSQGITRPGEALLVCGATVAVTGEAEWQDGTVDLTLELSDTRSGRRLDSWSVEDRSANVSVIQHDVTVGLAEMLGLDARADAHGRAVAGGTSIPRAYDLYLRGMGRMARADSASVESAIGLLEEALEEDPGYALAWAALGDAYWQRCLMARDFACEEDAYRSCERAATLGNEPASAHVTLGAIHMRNGRVNEAARAYEAALAIDPVHTEAHCGLAGAHAASGKSAQVELTYRRAAELRPGYWAGHNDLGIFYNSQGRYEEAALQFEKVVELTPGNAVGYRNLGVVYYCLERWEDARDAFRRALDIKPSYPAYSNLATLYFQETRYVDAARMYENALELDDSDYRVWGNLASSYLWVPEEQEKADAAYRRAAEKAEEQRRVTPHDPHLLCNLAAYYGSLRDRAKALPLLSEASALAPDDVEVMFQVGHTYERLGDRERALEWIGRALEHGYSRAQVDVTPGLRSFCADERYQELLSRVGAGS
jgi:serine/threonine-protein kinase